MKKGFSSYLVSWILLIAFFNIIAYLTSGQFKHATEAFWIGYAAVMAAGVVHLIYAFLSNVEKNREKQILNVPLAVLSYVEIVLIVGVGSACMLIPNLPGTVAAILCSLITICSVILFLAAKTVGEVSSDANATVNERTGDFRELVDKARLLAEKADESEKKKVLRKLYEAMRYSDPVSSEATRKAEERIDGAIKDISGKLEGMSVEELGKEVKKVLAVLEGRNAECMRDKRR